MMVKMMKKSDIKMPIVLNCFLRTLGLAVLILILNIVSFFMDGMTWSVIHIFLSCVFLGLCYFIIKSELWKKEWFWSLIICIGIGARIVYALTVHVPIISDQQTCLEAAQRLIAGDISWTKEPYFQRWAYQIPLVLYEAAVIKVFGGIPALYVLNILESIAICVLLFLIIQEIISDRLIALMVAAMFAITPSYIMHEGLIYNNILSAMLSLVAIYIFIMAKKRKTLFGGYLLCGVILAISQLIRSETIIWLLAIICFQIYELLCDSLQRKKGFKTVSETLIVILGFFFTLSIVSIGVKNSGLSSQGISNNCPYWFLVCGFTPDNYGEYSTRYAYIVDILDPEKQKVAFHQIMKEIFGEWNIKSFIVFWVGKMYRMWGAKNGPFAYGLDSSTWMQLLVFFDKTIYISTIILSFIGIKSKDTDKSKILMVIALLGFFCIFLLKEISVKYRYNPILCLFLLSAFGISKLIGKSQN